jgi:hypothetical protein
LRNVIKQMPLPTCSSKVGKKARRLACFQRIFQEIFRWTSIHGTQRCPYGKWICGDGREVIFNRMYWPILEPRPGEPAKPARPGEWIEGIVEDQYYFDDYDSPWSLGAPLAVRRDTIARVNAVLVQWGFPALPDVPPRPVSSGIQIHWFDPSAPIPPRQNPWDSIGRN